jgi:hypothetical protein
MDEYSKSGPKSESAVRRQREKHRQQLIDRLLEIEIEEDFVDGLRVHLDITPRHPAYRPSILIWREKHPLR